LSFATTKNQKQRNNNCYRHKSKQNITRLLLVFDCSTRIFNNPLYDFWRWCLKRSSRLLKLLALKHYFRRFVVLVHRHFYYIKFGGQDNFPSISFSLAWQALVVVY